MLGQLADALEAGLAFPAAVALVADPGPMALRGDFSTFRTRLRGADLASALDGLRRPGERTTDSVALLLRAALLDLPTGGLAPVLRELAGVLSERLEACERARTRTASLGLEAAILSVSPIVVLLLIGVSSPGFTAGHRLSVQYHVEKDESNYLLSGSLLLEQGESAETMRRRVLEPGAAGRNAPNVVHTIEALEDSVILEVSTPELHDVVRIEDRYGRPTNAPQG